MASPSGPEGVQAKTAGEAGSVARIVLVGAGSWAQGWHLPHLRRNPAAELVAIVDPAEKTWSKYNSDMMPTAELAASYGVPLFRSFVDFLQSDLAKMADGVIISTTHSTHCEIGLQAAAAGFHILVEKPMTANAAEAAELAAAAESMAAAGKVFMVNHSANFTRHALHARELVRERLGDIEHVTCYMIREREFFEDPLNRLWVSAEGSMTGNGFAWGQSCHTLAWVYMVTGLEPESVFCKMTYSKITGADVFTAALIQCANGATICCQGLAGLPGGNAVGSTSKRGKLIENKIFGSQGCLLYSGDDADPGSGRLEVLLNDGSTEVEDGFFFENTSKEGLGPESLRFFLAACCGGDFVNAADATIGRYVVQTIDAMYRSAKDGAVVKV
ncbi:pht4 [Symbiodinium natans]|uniref:Pht4 protein n=1 Tax=Symbiodinium natans TaxID=878477 RepID=A0A812I0P5_9DINO|nr:pht4 [Symbiodinium natans]